MIMRPEIALASISTLTEALEHCWKGSGLPAKIVADRLGIEYGHFVRMFRTHDPRHFPPDLVPSLMVECASLLPLEWLAWRMNYNIHEKSLGAVLEAIRDAMVFDGRPVRFSINHYGSVERL